MLHFFNLIRASLARVARRFFARKISALWAGLLYANTRRELLKFFLIRTKRKLQLRLGVWCVLSCEVNAPKKRRFIAAQNDNGVGLRKQRTIAFARVFEELNG